MSQSQNLYHSVLSETSISMFGLIVANCARNSFSLTGDISTFSFEVFTRIRFKEDAGEESGL